MQSLGEKVECFYMNSVALFHHISLYHYLRLSYIVVSKQNTLTFRLTYLQQLTVDVDSSRHCVTSDMRRLRKTLTYLLTTL